MEENYGGVKTTRNVTYLEMPLASGAKGGVLRALDECEYRSENLGE